MEGSTASKQVESKKSQDSSISDDLDARQTPTRRLPAWQLREQMKSQSRTPVAEKPVAENGSISRLKAGLKNDIDPNLPPAFRVAFTKHRKQRVDDFNSLASVHTATSTMLTDNSDNCSYSDDSFDGHDSFASLGGDEDEDDEAYREGRNQMARQEVEESRAPASHRGTLKGSDFRFKKTGIQGTTLDFIAE